MRRRLRCCALALTAALFAPHALRAVDYSPYHDVAEVEQRLRAWSSNSQATLLTIGQSAGGRNLHVLRLGAASDRDAVPATFVGANVAGMHNAGTEAALDLIARLLERGGHPILKTRTFYVAPVLNPDAHDAMFASPRRERRGNAMTIDRDVDGLSGEDDFEDLNGDGRITWMRIPDQNGDWLPHPQEPRLMVRADPLKQRAGAFRLEREGTDNDRDGGYNEDPREGIVVDMNFPKAFPYPRPEAGPWPTRAPESLALIRFFQERPNIALAVVYGPANNLLDTPAPVAPVADLGTQRFTVQPEMARMLGVDPEGRYTLDEVWEIAKGHPIVVENNVSREEVGQMLGAGPASRLEDADQKLLESMARDYKERLKNAGLDADRPGEQYSKGGLTAWLYYHFGILALELDVWGVPAGKAQKEEHGAAASATERLEAMTSEQFLALSEEAAGQLLRELKAPPELTASSVMARVRSGETTPRSLAASVRQTAGGRAPGKPDDDPATKRSRDVLGWIDANAPAAMTPWKAVTLPDGTRAEVGGMDPFIHLAPPIAQLAPAMAAHSALVIDLTSKAPRVEIASLDLTDLGAGVYRVRAVAANRGQLPTHTRMAERAQSRLPVRMRLITGADVSIVTGQPTVSSERLDALTGTLEGEWLVRAKSGTAIGVEVLTQDAGTDRKSIVAGRGGAR